MTTLTSSDPLILATTALVIVAVFLIMLIVAIVKAQHGR